MPTLINHPNNSASHEVADDGSITILMEDNETIIGEGAMHQTPISIRRHDKSVTFDDDTILCSTSKSHPSSSYSKRRRQTVDSEISLSLDDFHMKDTENNCPNARDTPHDGVHSSISPHISIRRPCTEIENFSWPNRDEYQSKHQYFVKNTISNFQKQHPGKLRDYRTMSPEEKAREQQRVLALLTRLGISRGPSGSSTRAQAQLNRECASAARTMMSPIPNRDKMILDETLSPAFTPNLSFKLEARYSNRPSSGDEKDYETRPNHHGVSPVDAERSELLVSMDKGHSNNDDSIGEKNGLGNSFDIPIGNDHDSDSCMELVRRAPRDDYMISDNGDDTSVETPEHQMIQKSSIKRLASYSGKRGADTFRKRTNDKENDLDISNRLGRLSLSPLDNSPPKNIFAASQSPISPKLTYNTPNDEDEYDAHTRDRVGSRIDWGLESDYHPRSNAIVETLATNTPPLRFRSEREKSRSFREVPHNVSLKDGATFHLDKLTVKRAEHTRSHRPSKTRMTTVQNRRLVNFPDPFTRYSNRSRRALKEIYSTIRNAERGVEQGDVDVPAAGVFFSLSEQQIIDVSIKLFLRDLAEVSSKRHQSASSSVLTGKTLVVVRSKEDTATWERALKEQSGCSVNNHSTLPLSERIRPSSAERACAYDVVLTTYDAMKSPDMAVPVNDEGQAILSKVGNDTFWHSSRTQSKFNSAPQLTKQLSFLHRIKFKRVIFVDNLGRKCFLAKGGTARASAAVALQGDTRIVFFQASDSDGADPLRALRKSDKKAIESVSKVLRLTARGDDIADENSYCNEDQSMIANPLETIAMDFRDLN
ncbi:hypothetical protein IV203_006239 [Nitzschia inconspicua]|uniref:Uncharacterized protein n=1 Tax=Nitzschia inconspicua TaxID=303405 RepID=A0A9K3PHA4_9STRA|nr:hypothetical protein IV203_006239 [Nitzschia inconspicua]